MADDGVIKIGGSGGFSTKSTYPYTSSSSYSSSSWTKWGGWGSGWSSGKKYKSSLGYGESSFYDYSRGSYYGKYSSTYTDPANKEDVEKLLVSAYKSVREAVVILDFPFRVDICFSVRSFFSRVGKKATSRKIFLSTKCLNTDTTAGKLSDADKIDILCGIGIHESSHLKYTQLQVLNSFRKKGDIKNKPLVNIFTNLLEDERVEDKLLRERPGYAEYITKKKNYDFNVLPKCSSSNVIGEAIKYLRYKDKLEEDSCIKDYPDIINGFGELFAENIMESTKDSCILGEKIVELIVNCLKSSLPEDEVNYMIRQIESHEDDFVEPVVTGLDESIPDSLSHIISERETSICSSDDLELFESMGDGDIERFSKAIFQNIEPDERMVNIYNSVKAEISKYVPALKKTLISSYKNYDFVIPGCRSGLLDTNKLAEAYQGVPQVYCRQGHVRTNGTVICVLIDESGSMGSGVNGSFGVSKASMARKTGILLNEAFGSLPGVDLFIYGHTADIIDWGTTEVRVYKEPGAKYNPTSLGSIQARCENRDGNAIFSVAKRVRKFTDQFCTFFVISDGSPSACDYRGSGAVSDTAEKIKTVRETMNMNVIGICIDSVPEMPRMYGSNYINLYSDISKFPSLLSKLIKNAISNNRETTIS